MFQALRGSATSHLQHAIALIVQPCLERACTSTFSPDMPLVLKTRGGGNLREQHQGVSVSAIGVTNRVPASTPTPP